jgi:hypothetical protein
VKKGEGASSFEGKENEGIGYHSYMTVNSKSLLDPVDVALISKSNL